MNKKSLAIGGPWWMLPIAFAAMLCLPLTSSSDYMVLVACIGCSVGVVVLGMVVLVGFTGQLSLGNVAFYSIGAYTAAITSTRWGVNPWIGLLLAAVTTGLVGALIGIPSFNLRGPFLVIVTIGFSEIVKILSMNLVGITGGPFGISGVQPLSFFGYELTEAIPFYYFIITVLFVMIFLIRRVRDSRTGRAMVAVMNDEIAADIMGVDVNRVKLLSFSISAMFAGIGGAMFAYFSAYVVTDMFTFNESAQYLVMTVIGGFSPLYSPLVAILLTMLPEVLRFLQEYYMLIFSFILLVSVLVAAWRQNKAAEG